MKIKLLTISIKLVVFYCAKSGKRRFSEVTILLTSTKW
nr:MAG TPA: DAP10 membrane protein [Caudoviricetes sp.]